MNTETLKHFSLDAEPEKKEATLLKVKTSDADRRENGRENSHIIKSKNEVGSLESPAIPEASFEETPKHEMLSIEPKEVLTRVSDEIVKMNGKVQKFIRKHPIAVLSAAMGLGVLTYTLIKRLSSKE